MKERVLITGASGFVGYHLIIAALKNNLEVYAAVRKSSNISHLKDLDIEYTDLRYTDVAALEADIKEKQYTYIIHAAGVTRARTIEEYNSINADNTFNLASAAAAAGVKKFVLISSLAAVGPIDDINDTITEDTPARPVTAYGKSKLIAEEKLAKVGNLNYTILRPTAVYGPRDTGIFIFFKQLSKGIEAYIGKFQQKLSFIYVTDLADASIIALKNGTTKAYILSDGNGYAKDDLGKEGKKALGIKTLKIHVGVIFMKMVAIVAEKVSNLKGEAPILNTEKLSELTAINWTCDIGPAKKDLNFDPKYNLSEGVAETIKWYKLNKWL